MKKIKKSGLSSSKQLVETNLDQGLDIPDISYRVTKIMEIINQKRRLYKNSVFTFITYDIEDNKIRGHISKYLQRQGLIRVQYSIFFGDLERQKFNKIKETLKAINDMYKNHDSIFIIPVGEDVLNKTKVIGKNIDFEVIAEVRSTLFI